MSDDEQKKAQAEFAEQLLQYYEVHARKRCTAEAVTGNSNKPCGTHTHRCEKDAGHELEDGNTAHEWIKDGRTVSWYGEPKKAEDNTNYRWGLRPGWITR